jgi:hypothetical protein
VLQRHATVVTHSSRMADLEQLLYASNVCQVVTDEDVKTLEDIKNRMGMNRFRLVKKAAAQVRVAIRGTQLALIMEY